jgi:hypothetical protein
MAKFLNRLKILLLSYDWEIIEVQGAVFKTAWGFWLLLPFPVFRAISGYNAAGKENIWGWGLFALGVFHLYAIFSNKLKLRRWVTFVAFLFWIFTVILILQQSKTSVLIPMFSIIAFFMGLNFVRMGTPPMLLDDQRKVNLGPPPGIRERRKTL